MAVRRLLIATRHATSRQMHSPIVCVNHAILYAPAHSPVFRRTCALPSPYLGRCTLGFHAKIRGCSAPGRRMVGRRWGEGGEAGGAFVATWRTASRLRSAQRLCGFRKGSFQDAGGVCSDVACRVAIKNHRGVYAGNGVSRGDLGRGGAEYPP